MENFKSFFDRVVAISLDRRRERWLNFLKNLPPGWPFRYPMRFRAVDGNTITPPNWWRENNGAWGCFSSHLQVLRDCIKDHVNSVLILEDDALFCPDFSQRVRDFIANLPNDWQFLYFGGQHIELHLGIPQRINEFVYRPFNVNRTHAYAIRGVEAMQKVEQHLTAIEFSEGKHHVDHHLGEFQKTTNAEGIYVPAEWLVWQAANQSDIRMQSVGQRRFHGALRIAEPKLSLPVVAVVGTYGSGSGIVAGVLDKLGVKLGQRFEGTSQSSSCDFEDSSLSEICRSCFSEPWLVEKLDRQVRARLFRIWADLQTAIFQADCSIVGAHHPILSLAIPEIETAWDLPKIVCVERERQPSIISMLEAKSDWPLDTCMSMLQQMSSSLNAALSTTRCPVLRVTYEEMATRPEDCVTAICKFVGLSPDTVTLLDTMNFLDAKGLLPS